LKINKIQLGVVLSVCLLKINKIQLGVVLRVCVLKINKLQCTAGGCIERVLIED